MVAVRRVVFVIPPKDGFGHISFVMKVVRAFFCVSDKVHFYLICKTSLENRIDKRLFKDCLVFNDTLKKGVAKYWDWSIVEYNATLYSLEKIRPDLVIFDTVPFFEIAKKYPSFLLCRYSGISDKFLTLNAIKFFKEVFVVKDSFLGTDGDFFYIDPIFELCKTEKVFLAKRKYCLISLGGNNDRAQYNKKAFLECIIELISKIDYSFVVIVNGVSRFSFKNKNVLVIKDWDFIGKYYNSCTFAITGAGCETILERLFYNVPGVLWSLPTRGGQYKYAEMHARASRFSLFSGFNPDALYDCVKNLISNNEEILENQRDMIEKYPLKNGMQDFINEILRFLCLN